MLGIIMVKVHSQTNTPRASDNSHNNRLKQHTKNHTKTIQHPPPSRHIHRQTPHPNPNHNPNQHLQYHHPPHHQKLLPKDLTHTLRKKTHQTPPKKPIVTSKDEAHIIALARSEPPQDYAVFLLCVYCYVC